MGTFCIEIDRNKLGKMVSKLIGKCFGWDAIPFEKVTIGFVMDRKPTEKEIEILSNKMTSIGVKIEDIRATWSK